MKNSTALTLLRVYQSHKTQFAATPLLCEFVDQYAIGWVIDANVHFTPTDKEAIYRLLIEDKRITKGQFGSTVPRHMSTMRAR